MSRNEHAQRGQNKGRKPAHQTLCNENEQKENKNTKIKKKENTRRKKKKKTLGTKRETGRQEKREKMRNSQPSEQIYNILYSYSSRY